MSHKNRTIKSSKKTRSVSAYKKGSRCLPCKDYPRCRGAWAALIWAADAARVASHHHRPRGRPVNPKEAVKRRRRDRRHLLDSSPPWILNWRCSGEKWYLPSSTSRNAVNSSSKLFVTSQNLPSYWHTKLDIPQCRFSSWIPPVQRAVAVSRRGRLCESNIRALNFTTDGAASPSLEMAVGKLSMPRSKRAVEIVRPLTAAINSNRSH